MNNRVSTSNSVLFQKEKLECLKLSNTELNIARLLAWGYTQKEIAEMVHRSPLTISVHLRNIYRQLGIHKETDLTRWYLFKEYHINDNPFKKVLAVLFLMLSISSAVFDISMVRVFRSVPMRTAVKVAKPIREKRYRNVFELQLITA
jgi:DNA-binding CsgD family transcriptional regulator